MMDAFMQSLARSGLSTKEKIVADGQLHRFHVNGDRPGSLNGWYVLFYGGIPAGAFGSWKTGEKHSWCLKDRNQLTTAERKEYKRQMSLATQARAEEQEKRHNTARKKAEAIWKKSRNAPGDHPYLLAKAVRNHGLRLYKSSLVMPLRDGSGILWSLQFIAHDGEKQFLSGARIRGCYFAIGTPVKAICIAEGYATGASIYEATGHAVAVALNAGNMIAVARTIRAKFPAIKIILCADNDTKTKGNPGVTKAREAARAVGGVLAIPNIDGDFNDLFRGGCL